MEGQKTLIAKVALYDVEEPSAEELCNDLLLLVDYLKANGSSQYLKNPFWKIVMRLSDSFEFRKKEGDLKAGSKTEIRKKVNKD